MNKLLFSIVLVFACVAQSATTVVYLSDLSWVSATSGWSTVQKDKSINQSPITIGKTVYAKGLGVHALSDVVYKLNKLYSTFTSDYGIDTEVSGTGSSVFNVYVNDSLAFASALITGKMGKHSLSVSVDGKDSLKLEVTTGGDNYNNDDGDWGGAQLTLKTVTAVSPSPAAGKNISEVRILNGMTLNYLREKAGSTVIKIFDVRGDVLRSMRFDNQQPGNHSVSLLKANQRLPGVFIVSLSTDGSGEIRKTVSGLR
jgi:hypothetical protein